MASPTYYGGCFCRANRYKLSGPMRQLTFCHCSACRHVSGSPFLPFVGLPSESFSWTSQGTSDSSGSDAKVPSSTLKTLRITEFATRTFCANCGTPLTMQYTPERMSVTTGSVDDEHAEALKELLERGSKESSFTDDQKPHNIFVESKVPWADFATWAQVPEFDKFPPGHKYPGLQ